LLELVCQPLDLKLLTAVLGGDSLVLQENLALLLGVRTRWGWSLFVEEFCAVEGSLRDFLEEKFAVHPDDGLILQVDGFDDSQLVLLVEVDLIVLIEDLEVFQSLLWVLQVLELVFLRFFLIISI
jgi:hypothetical protein